MNRRRRTASRLLAAAAAIALATGWTVAAWADPDADAVYMLRFAQEVSDGRAVVSTSRDSVVARGRRGDRSVTLHDFQSGAITVERSDRVVATPLLSTREIDVSQGFDYRNSLASGGASSVVFNLLLRPLLQQGPPAGQDGDWQVATSLSALGLGPASGGQVTIRLRRTALVNDGAPVVLVEYEIPAFTYLSAEGETLVHWAHGFAVTDREFSQVYALGTQHRASATGADGASRPISIRTSLHGIDRAGSWRMRFGNAPAIRAAVERTLATAGDRSAPVTQVSDTIPARSFAFGVAGRLDQAAFALGEGGLNPIGQTLAANTSPAPAGAEEVISADANARIGASITQAMSDFQNSPMMQAYREMNDRMNQGGPGPASPAPAGADEVMSADANARIGASITQAMSDFHNSPMMRAYREMSERVNQGGPGLESVSPEQLRAMAAAMGFGPPVNPLGEMRIDLEAVARGMGMTRAEFDDLMARDAIGATNAQPVGDPFIAEMVLSPTGLLGSFNTFMSRLAEAGQQTDAATGSRMTFIGTPALGAAMLERMGIRLPADNRPFIDLDALAAANGMTRAQLNAQFERTRTQMMLGNPNAATTAGDLDALVSQMARQAEAEGNLGAPRLTPPSVVRPDPAESIAAWIAFERVRDATRRNEDETLYRLLRAQIERELNEARRDERRRQQREESGIDSLDAFVRNNAFTYTSMVGVVPTDLSRWAAWLATQNVRELERLARLAGYPNLASALNDAGNLIRYADDDGYRQWARQAPSCGGLIGCGPSYLERWWMRQATVSLGDILGDSRGVFSTGGFSDVGISGLSLSYLLRDNALQDGDIVDVRITQFGRVLFQGRTNLTNLGERYSHLLRQGVASLEIFAVNEGFSSPNTAEITLDNVVRGDAVQSYSLSTGETATLRIETNAGAR